MTKPTEAQTALFRSLGDCAKRLERTLEGYWSGEMPAVEAQKSPESFIPAEATEVVIIST